MIFMTVFKNKFNNMDKVNASIALMKTDPC